MIKVLSASTTVKLIGKRERYTQGERIKDQEQKLLELERQEEEIAATEIGRIVIEHLENGKPFDDEFKERVSSIIVL